MTVNGVKDLSGNAIASISQSFIAFNIFANFNDGQLPPGAAATVAGGRLRILPQSSPRGAMTEVAILNLPLRLSVLVARSSSRARALRR